jgi:hypothetical protein
VTSDGVDVSASVSNAAFLRSHHWTTVDDARGEIEDLAFAETLVVRPRRCGRLSLVSATRCHQPSFANNGARIAISQTIGLEVGPDLLRAISINPPNRKPMPLGQSNRFARFNLRSETGQGDDNRSQKAEYC